MTVILDWKIIEKPSFDSRIDILASRLDYEEDLRSKFKHGAVKK